LRPESGIWIKASRDSASTRSRRENTARALERDHLRKSVDRAGRAERRLDRTCRRDRAGAMDSRRHTYQSTSGRKKKTTRTQPEYKQQAGAGRGGHGAQQEAEWRQPKPERQADGRPQEREGPRGRDRPLKLRPAERVIMTGLPRRVRGARPTWHDPGLLSLRRGTRSSAWLRSTVTNGGNRSPPPAPREGG